MGRTTYHDRQANKLPDCAACTAEEKVRYGDRYYAERMRGSYGFSWYAICRGCQRAYTMAGNAVTGDVQYGTAD